METKTNILGLTRGETVLTSMLVVGLTALGIAADDHQGEKRSTLLNGFFPAEKFSQVATFKPIQDEIREELLKVFVVPGECPGGVLSVQTTCNPKPPPTDITDCAVCPGNIQDIK